MKNNASKYRSVQLALVCVVAAGSLLFSLAGEIRAQTDPALATDTTAIGFLKETAASKGYSLLDLARKTGWFVYPMGFFSVYALYLILFNLVSLRSARLVPDKLLQEASFHLAEGNLAHVQQIIANRQDLVSIMLRSGLARVGHDRQVIQQAMQSAVTGPLVRLRIHYRRLADVGNLAPMLGLLGTVWGMIQVFKVVASDSASMIGNWSSALANGVAMAMVTTVEGLLIAIPALFFYYVFRNRMSRLVGVVQLCQSDLSDLLSRRMPSDQASLPRVGIGPEKPVEQPS